MKDKVVMITGASSGIGEELAYAFAIQGAKLVLASRREEELQRVKDNCKCNAEDILVLPLDLSQTENFDSLIDHIINKFGKIDILINNAGISQRSLALETVVEVERKIMEVNFFGTIALTKSVLSRMVENKSGHIVVISSIAGKCGVPLRSAYSASKHALHGFFDTLRAEVYNDNIRITMVCPGLIKTGISYNALTKDGTKHNKMDKGQENGIGADKCARKIIKAIKRNKQEVLIGGKEILLVHLRKFFPRLFFWILRRIN